MFDRQRRDHRALRRARITVSSLSFEHDPGAQPTPSAAHATSAHERFLYHLHQQFMVDRFE